MSALQETTQTENKEDLQKRLVSLIEKKEALIEQLKALKPEMEMLMNEVGIGNYFQVDNTVYKIEVPKGTYVEFKTIDYNRTRKEGEKGGNYLAKKEAEEKGFALKGKE